MKPITVHDGDIWIELSPHTGDVRFAERQCEVANRVLKAIYGPKCQYQFFYGLKGRYCLVINEAGSFLECADNGHWFKVP